MPFISIALMGFFAFSGAPQAPVDATTTEIGIPAAVAAVPATSGPLTRLSGEAADPLSVMLTAYNAVPSQTDSNPDVTASGAFSNPEVVLARSSDLAADLPYGTVVAIEYTGKDTEGCRYNAISGLIGYRVVADAMNARMHGKVDLLLNPKDTVTVHGKEMNPAVALGLCHSVTVRPVGRLKISDIPATQEELREMIEGKSLALNK
jgi:3D (Asp-Asp-Asp) domain-containing protein